MNADVWTLILSALVALAALGLAAFAVARMSRTAPVKVAIVITTLTGFVVAIPPLISAFSTLRG
jgi:hypothetical protein